MKKFVIISKDALCRDYLPTYGNKQWSTPNIDAIAAQGTVFTNHYTAAPSTVMSFFSMITGKFAYETGYELYEKINAVYEGETLFTKLRAAGYQCHIIWGDIWMPLPNYYNCYRDAVQLHRIDGFRQGVGAHYKHEGFLKPDPEKEEKTYSVVTDKIREVLESEENVFLWIHFPHVINGRVAYGSDIDLFDRYIGFIRSLVPDNCLALTADHGNMNGHKGKVGYGFDVYQPAVNIPLITPRIDGRQVISDNTSSVDLYSILFEGKYPKREFIYCDTAFKAQMHRRLAIIYKHYKYIYIKQNKSEELYDLAYDPTEEFSLMQDYIFDKDRNITVPSRELYYYPDWENIDEIRTIMRRERERMWQNGSLTATAKDYVKDILRPAYVRLTKRKI